MASKQKTITLGRPPRAAEAGTLADKIRQARLRRGLTAQQLADRLGVRLQTIYDWELRGQRPTSYRAIAGLAEVLGVRLKP